MPCSSTRRQARSRCGCFSSSETRIPTIDSTSLLRLLHRPPLTRYATSNCIHLLDCFEHHGHVCIVSELLSSSVFDFLKDNQYQPFPFKHIHDFARQLLDSVKCTSSLPLVTLSADDGSPAVLHSLDLIHTDLKPENILLEDVSSNIVVQAVSLVGLLVVPY